MRRLISLTLFCLALNIARADFSPSSTEESQCDLYRELTYVMDSGEKKCVDLLSLNTEAPDMGLSAKADESSSE